MSGISERVGPYRHAAGFRHEMVFEGGRTFTVVMAGAYDAGGLVGPEHNGLVVIDADNASIVLDQHKKESTGYYGPSAAQKAEFVRVCALTDWKSFTDFVRQNRRYRTGSVPDINEPKPQAPGEAAIVLRALNGGTLPGVPGPSILPERYAAYDADPAVPYDFPLRTKLDIVAFIASHAMHRDGHSPVRLAWDIKVHNPDVSGTSGETPPNPAYDDLWKAYVAANDHVYQDACGDGLRQYLDGEATVYPGEGQGDYAFEVTGRSGGWLELASYKGNRIGFRSIPEFVDDLLEMDDADLVGIYVALRTFDKDIDPKREVAFQMSCAREAKEEEWSADPEAARELADELGLHDWEPPAPQAAPAA
jgi:hypothetical protein